MLNKVYADYFAFQQITDIRLCVMPMQYLFLGRLG